MGAFKIRRGRAVVTAPANTVAPVISGSTHDGDTGTCSTGTWIGTATITFTYQWKKDGTNIAGQTANTYTYATGDISHNITCVVTAHNAAGNVSATSNTVVPSSAGSNPLANNAALFAMLNAGVGASGGKTYTLASGVNFGDGNFWGYNFSSNPIVLQGQSGTTFNYIQCDTTKGITWKDMVVTGTASSPNAALAMYNGCDNLIFNKVRLVNASATEGTPAFATGLFMRNNAASTNIQFIGSKDTSIPDIWGFGNGVNAIDANFLTIKDVTFGNNGSDHILFYGTNNSTLDGLINGTCYDPGHPDFIQTDYSGDTGLPNRNLTVKNCGVQRLAASTTGSQAYFFAACQNLTLDGNWAYDAYGNAVSFSDNQTVLCNNNYLQPVNDTGSGAAITTRGASTNVTIQNNYAYSINTYAPEGPYPGYSESGNTLITTVVNPGDYAALDVWLAANPNARRRYA